MSLKTLALIVAAALAAAPLTAQTAIGAGETVTGRLEEGDRQMEDGAYYDPYVLRGRAGEALLVRMRSNDFDTYLYWGRGRGDDWYEEGGSDDHGEGTDSRLGVELSSAGVFELRAAGFDEDQTGTYELRVTAITGDAKARPLRVGQTVHGDLSEDSYQRMNGPEDHYVIEGRPGEQITVYAESDDFDTYLEFGRWVADVLATTAEDDDGGEGTNSEMVAEFGENGVYHVMVRSFSGEEVGAYTLRVVEGAVQDEWDDDEPDDEEWVDEDPEDDSDYDSDDDSGDDSDEDSSDEADFSGVGHTIIPVRAGEPVEGALGEDNAQDGDGIYYQQFTYRARAGERLTISVTSEETDTFVRIGTGTYDEFESLGEDDDSGGELNAELSYTVPRAGEYVIQVSTAAPGQTGPFVLRVRSGR